MASFNFENFTTLLENNPSAWAPLKDMFNDGFFEGQSCLRLRSPHFGLKKVNALYDMYCNATLKEIVRLLKLFQDIYFNGQKDFSAQIDIHNTGALMQEHMYDFYHNNVFPEHPDLFDEFELFSNRMFGTSNIKNYEQLIGLTTPDRIKKALEYNTTIIGKLRQIETNWNDYYSNIMGNPQTLNFDD